MRWVIAGGGPSLIGFNWSCLFNKHVIAVNRSFKKLPNAAMIYFSDLRFWEWSKDELLLHPAKKITCAKVDHPDVTRYHFAKTRKPLSFEKGILRGGNSSGYAAINLAVQHHATEIILLGFDMVQNADGRSNWHNDYPAHACADAYTHMLPEFQKLAPVLNDLGIRVVNVGLTSKINVFEKMSIEDFYKTI